MVSADVIAIKAAVVIAGLYITYAYLMRFECQVLGRLSLRGEASWGILWPLVSAARAMRKPNRRVPGAWHYLYVAAPWCALCTALFSLALIPDGLAFAVAGHELTFRFRDLDIGLALVVAAWWLGLLGALLGAWSSRSAYLWVEGQRVFSLGMGYSLAAMLALAGVVLLSRSLSLVAPIHARAGALPLALYQPLGFVVCALALVAGGRRLPYSLPGEGATPLGDWHVQHAGSVPALYHLAEYLQILFSSALLATIYLGSGSGPWSSGPHWLLLKTLLASVVLLWLRAGWLARRRPHLGHRGWLILCALAALNLLLTGLIVGW